MLARFGILPALRQQGRLDWHGPRSSLTFWCARSAAGNLLLTAARRIHPRRIARLNRSLDHEVIVIGAGIAGLSAARELAAAGRSVLVLDKGRGLGGRMATRRLGPAVFDHGAQFFTVRGRAFGGIVAEAHAAGSVKEWCRGFSRDGSLGDASQAEGHPRWRGGKAMTDLPKWLAGELTAATAAGRCTIRSAAKVTAVAAGEGRVRVSIEGDDALTAAGALVSSPVPQSLELLAAGGLTAATGAPADAAAFAMLETVAYDPCFALLLVLDRPSRVPAPGGVQFDPATGGPIAWIADNQKKGISPLPALTVHADGGFSRRHFDAPPEEVIATLIDHARPWIDGDPATAVIEKSLHRWKFALPTTILPEPLVAVSHAPPIACCGDAFAGPRVEGAASSGLAAGRWLARVLAGGDAANPTEDA
jgi:renalase